MEPQTIRTEYRPYPIAVTQAARALALAGQVYCDISDLYQHGAADEADVSMAWDAYILVLGWQTCVAHDYMHGALTEQVLDHIVEQELRDAEIAEDHELGRIGRGG